MEWITDDSFVIRGAETMDPTDGSTVLRIRDSADAQWRDVLRWPQDENGGGVAFSKEGSSIYVLVLLFMLHKQFLCVLQAYSCILCAQQDAGLRADSWKHYRCASCMCRCSMPVECEFKAGLHVLRMSRLNCMC